MMMLAKRYAANPARSALTATLQHLTSLHYAEDRMHFKRHTDPWYRAHCNPDKFGELDNVSHF